MRRSRRACPAHRYVDFLPPLCAVCREQPAADGVDICRGCFDRALDELTVQTRPLPDAAAAAAVLARLEELGIPRELLRSWTEAQQ